MKQAQVYLRSLGQKITWWPEQGMNIMDTLGEEWGAVSSLRATFLSERQMPAMAGARGKSGWNNKCKNYVYTVG